MTRPNWIAPITLALALLGAAAAAEQQPATEQPAATFAEALSKGKINLNLRYRLEDVDQDGFEKGGRASTLRTALAYRTLRWRGFMGLVEFEDVRDLGLADDHNNGGAGSLGNGEGGRPVVPDPSITEVNQGYLDWQLGAGFTLRGGRQEVVVDNARLVGNVGWRQNHQSFDAVRLQFAPTDRLSLATTYFGRQRTVTGASRPLQGGHLEAAYTFANGSTIRAYMLALDFDQAALRSLSSRTLGASFSGSTALSDTVGLTYRAEAAKQVDAGDNPGEIDAIYARGDLGLRFRALTVAAGYELLEGSPEAGAFNTPLATLHAFNGWADMFLATPSNGLKDAFVSAGAKLARWDLLAVYHDYSADTGGASLGTEINARAVYTAQWKQKFAVELARFNADAWKTDTAKLWLWTQWSF